MKTITLNLSEEDWVEVYYALYTKYNNIVNGKYSDNNSDWEREQKDKNKWASDIEKIILYLEGKLEEEEIPF